MWAYAIVRYRHIFRLGSRRGVDRKESEVLILSRKVGEMLVIGGDIEITVLGSKGNQVRLGINAPKEISVHREEVQAKVTAEIEQQ